MRLRKTLTNRPLCYPRTKHARNRQWVSIALALFIVAAEGYVRSSLLAMIEAKSTLLCPVVCPIAIFGNGRNLLTY
jgi:hypothetical protein